MDDNEENYNSNSQNLIEYNINNNLGDLVNNLENLDIDMNENISNTENKDEEKSDSEYINKELLKPLNERIINRRNMILCDNKIEENKAKKIYISKKILY